MAALCAVMARAHSCAVPDASAAHPVFSLPQSLAHRRAASTPEALPDFLLAASMPAELSRMEDADGMTGESPSPTRTSQHSRAPHRAPAARRKPSLTDVKSCHAAMLGPAFLHTAGTQGVLGCAGSEAR